MFNILDSEQLYPEIERHWNENHDYKTLAHVEKLLSCNHSLWFTDYGRLYQNMCRYFNMTIPSIPARIRESKYLIVIYKRYET